jgi:hypothetical protein
MTVYLHGKYLSGIKMFQQESHITHVLETQDGRNTDDPRGEIS